MAEYTEKLNLKKPSPEDFYNIADFNANADILEQEISSIKEWITAFKTWDLNNKYPVGIVIEFGNGIDPNESIGGTWEVFGPGRTSVCYDPDDPDFDELGKTGGSKTASYPLGNEGYAKMDVQSGSPFVWEYARTSVPNYSTTIKVTGGSGSRVSDNATSKNRGVPLGGATGAGDNMQPYIVSKKWIRIA